MKKYFFTVAFVSVLITGAIVSASPSNVQYPVEELGNCAGESDCRTYCDDSSNAEACLNFAERHNLMSAEEVQTARNFLTAGSGPGGCTGKDSCETYCNSIDRIDECVAYAEKHNLMSAKDLEEAKKVQAAKARGVKMPACGGKKECDSYCSQASHMEECIAFAQEAGFMSPEELEDSKKVLAAIKAGAAPPPCRGKTECDAYCSEESNFDACLNFALAAGFMDQKDAEMAKKTKGKGPGDCRGKEECDAFCQKDENMEICAQFAYDNGMMTKEDFENFKKTGGKGPGDCKGKEECENFCKDPTNQRICFDFAKERGMISQEDLQQMERQKRQFKETMQDMPPEISSCLELSVGADNVSKFKNGEAMPPREMGDQMKECFEKNMRQESPQGDRGLFKSGMTPETPCQTPEECQQYCNDNPEACNDFQPGPGQMNSGGDVMPPKDQRGYAPPNDQMFPRDKMSPEGEAPPKSYMLPEGKLDTYQIMPPESRSEFAPSEGYMPPEDRTPMKDQMPIEGYMPPEGESKPWIGPEQLLPKEPPTDQSRPTGEPAMSEMQGPLMPSPEKNAPAPIPSPESIPMPAPEQAPSPAPIPEAASAIETSSYLQYSPFGAILNFFLGR